jgi:hypothetical protein
MQPIALSSPFCTAKSEAKVPYSDAALSQDLQRVRNLWDQSQANRQRDAIYSYLGAVYTLVGWWAAEGRETERSRGAVRLLRLEPSDREDPFGAVIRCTADPAKADKRTRSKWSRVMRYAVAYKLDSESLEQFVRRKGGINTCVARFSRRLGREQQVKAWSAGPIQFSAGSERPDDRVKKKLISNNITR